MNNYIICIPLYHHLASIIQKMLPIPVDIRKNIIYGFATHGNIREYVKYVATTNVSGYEFMQLCKCVVANPYVARRTKFHVHFAHRIQCEVCDVFCNINMIFDAFKKYPEFTKYVENFDISRMGAMQKVYPMGLNVHFVNSSLNYLRFPSMFDFIAFVLFIDEVNLKNVLLQIIDDFNCKVFCYFILNYKCFETWAADEQTLCWHFREWLFKQLLDDNMFYIVDLLDSPIYTDFENSCIAKRVFTYLCEQVYDNYEPNNVVNRTFADDYIAKHICNFL